MENIPVWLFKPVSGKRTPQFSNHTIKSITAALVLKRIKASMVNCELPPQLAKMAFGSQAEQNKAILEMLKENENPALTKKHTKRETKIGEKAV